MHLFIVSFTFCPDILSDRWGRKGGLNNLIMETLNAMMHYILSETEKFLNTNYGLHRFENSSPFWMADESSYMCFI